MNRGRGELHHIGGAVAREPLLLRHGLFLVQHSKSLPTRHCGCTGLPLTQGHEGGRAGLRISFAGGRDRPGR